MGWFILYTLTKNVPQVENEMSGSAQVLPNTRFKEIFDTLKNKYK